MKKMFVWMMIAIMAALCCAPQLTRAESMEDKLGRLLVEKYKGTVQDDQLLEDPENRYAFAGVRNIRHIAQLTGEDSENQTLSKYGAGGTDLGYMANMNGKTYFFFGDTHVKHSQSAPQKHNSCAFTTDNDYTDGITLDGMIVEEDGNFKELFPAYAGKGMIEAATIPGGAIALNDTLYVSYHSVRQWTQSDVWYANFGSFIKSTDEGQHWTRVESMTWPGDSCFVQNCPILADDTVYVFGTGSGRGHPMELMRVPAAQFEDYGAYEYLMGYDEKGAPVWEKGDEAMKNALALLPDAGEFSVMYSEYLGEWITMYRSHQYGVSISASKNLWGPYSEPLPLFEDKKSYGTPYCTVMNPQWTSEDGSRIGFIMSLWWPVYNVAVMELELIKK